MKIAIQGRVVVVSELKGKEPNFKVACHTKRITGPIECRKDIEFWVDVPVKVPKRTLRSGMALPERSTTLHFDLDTVQDVEELVSILEEKQSEALNAKEKDNIQ